MAFFNRKLFRKMLKECKAEARPDVELTKKVVIFFGG